MGEVTTTVPGDRAIGRVLAVGCGHKAPAPNTIRLDISPDVHPDVVWNLDNFPYPFADGQFAAIECLDTIEHLQNIPRVMEEFHRILQPGGRLTLTTPHFSCANSYIDPTHRYHLSYFSFDYFCDGHQLAYYSKARYRIRQRYLNFEGGWFSRVVVARLANRFPRTYERRWAWLFPAWFAYFELEAI